MRIALFVFINDKLFRMYTYKMFLCKSTLACFCVPRIAVQLFLQPSYSSNQTDLDRENKH